MTGKTCTKYIVILLLLAAVSLTFRPGLWLMDKPAANQNQQYAKGWSNGCLSGTNSYSLLYAPLLDRPFVKEIDTPAEVMAQANNHTPKTAEKTNYQMGWNEGFTLCRYYQSSVYELMQFAILITTLLFIGYLISRPRQKDF